MLLTSKYQVDPPLATELKRLKAKNIYILGGEAAVSKAVETELKKTYTVKRISGSDRKPPLWQSPEKLAVNINMCF